MDFPAGSSSGIINNIIHNHDFCSGVLDPWTHDNGCKATVETRKDATDSNSGWFARVRSRTESWQGLEQDITDRLSKGSTYTLLAHVGISGTAKRCEDVEATLRLETHGSPDTYETIAKKCIRQGRMDILEGKFTLPETMPHKVVFYIEGPPPGVDILIESVVISTNAFSCRSNQYHKQSRSSSHDSGEEGKMIFKDEFDSRKGMNWSGNGCQIKYLGPQSGKHFASSLNRTQSWHGIQRDLTGKVLRKRAYEVVAVVRLHGNSSTGEAGIEATVRLEFSNKQPEQYITVAKVMATGKEWVRMQGKFLIDGHPTQVVLYLEGPPPGVDILLNSFVVKHAAKPPPSRIQGEGAAYGVNIITNSNLTQGTNGWSPNDRTCKLSVANGSPPTLPPMAIESLGAHHQHHLYVTGRHILAKNRAYEWVGPSQTITDKVKPYLTYQVAGWVRVGPGAYDPQRVCITLKVDADTYVNVAQVEISDDKWREIGGSFRIEEQAGKLQVYVHGPAPGIDLMVAGFHVFPVDRKARFAKLSEQTDKIRKCDVELKLPGSASGAFIRVKQTQSSFPFGSCLMRKNMDNEDFTDFFAKNFNWAVFANELKWYWTEKKQGSVNYEDADALLKFCTDHNLKVRGHCIFWEVKSHVQDWVRNLNKTELKAVVETRLDGLLSRFKDKFQHYDVNNEMMHGSFYQKKIGDQIRADMFKIAKKKDPKATLFVNDYHVEDGYDADSSPDKYIEHIKDLQKHGAPVGGIAIQGHIDNPVGSIVRAALDKMAILGLPIWFTELEVSSVNEYVRADDLEVMLREAYAHPAVEGVMLWGFWELSMSRENSHLVNAEGDLNEAGRRYIALKEEWLTRASGHADGHGRFRFRGFPGSYELEIGDGSKKVKKKFVINKAKGEQSVVEHITL